MIAGWPLDRSNPDGLRGRMEYNTDVFEAETIVRMLEHYQVLLIAAVADPALRVSARPTVDSKKRQSGAMVRGSSARTFST